MGEAEAAAEIEANEGKLNKPMICAGSAVFGGGEAVGGRR